MWAGASGEARLALDRWREPGADLSVLLPREGSPDTVSRSEPLRLSSRGSGALHVPQKPVQQGHFLSVWARWGLRCFANGWHRGQFPAASGFGNFAVLAESSSSISIPLPESESDSDSSSPA